MRKKIFSSRAWQIWPIILVTMACASYHRPGVEPSAFNFPEAVYFRTNQASYNDRYSFLINDGVVFYKPRSPQAGKHESWTVLPVDRRMKKAVSLSADDQDLMVIDEYGWIFTMFHGLEEEKDFRWTKRWGFPFWFGRGFKLTGEYLKWDVSFLSPETDQYIQYPNGNKHDVGIGCTTIFLLNKDGRRITFIDPWLVNDLSNEITTPGKGVFKAVNLSASGSTLFVIDSRGRMYTLLFDFDIAGMDTIFFHYSYHEKDWVYNGEPGDVVPRKVPRPLPLEGWIEQPSPPGPVTKEITILKEGTGARHRRLLVEGMKDDRRGYYTKDIRDKEWLFVETKKALSSPLLSSYEEPVSFSGGFRFKGEIILEGIIYRALIPDFNPYCFSSSLRLTPLEGEPLDLVLYHTGTIRLTRRERGLSSKPLILNGAIRGAELQLFQDYKEVTIKVTREKLKIKGKNLKGILLFDIQE